MSKTLADCVTFINGDRGKNYPKQVDFANGEVPFISATDLSNHSLSNQSDYQKKISKSAYEKLRSGKVIKKDVLLCLRGSLGKLGVVSDDMVAAIASSLVILRSNAQINSEFLFQWLRSPEFQQTLASFDNGSVQGNLSVKSISTIEVPNFSPNHQRAIAHILGTLDDKIELNQKMNQTLEEIAKAIFKSWFVDFDPVRAKAEGRPTGLPPEISDLFPDELVDTEIGEIPKGWSIHTSSEFCDSVRDGTHDSPKPVREGGHPLVTSKHIKGGILDFSSANRISTEDFAAVNKRSEVSDGDVLISMIGTLGELYFVDEQPTYAIKNIGLFKAKSKELGLWFYLFLKSRSSQEYLKISAQGSTQQYLSLKTLRNIPVISPSKSVLSNFSLISSPIFERIKTAKDEIKTLSELRDTLLPKLISGELHIPDAEKFLEEAGI
tara:strand:+ start:150 stop:1460 length:1311 start_codon:yes stop_codon:yes gene_type:complete